MCSFSSHKKCHEGRIVLATPFIERDRVFWGDHGNIREINEYESVFFPRMP